MIYGLLADLVVVIHAGFVAFVVLGGLLVLRWPRLAWAHIPAAVWGVLIEFAGWICPLTPLENWFRARGGQAGYAGGFVDHYIMPVLYPEALTRSTQLVLGTSVLVLNVVVYGILARRMRRGRLVAGSSQGGTPMNRRRIFLSGVIVAVAAPIVGAAQGRQLRLIEELRLDAKTENFSVVGAVLVGRTGSMVVPQSQDGKYLFFDSAGRRVGELGRKGQGPGEFGQPGFANYGWTHDTVWVFDPSTSRITLMSARGTLVRMIPFQQDAPASARLPALSMRPVTIRPDGSILARSHTRPPYPAGFDTSSLPVVGVSTSGPVVGVVAAFPREPDAAFVSRQTATQAMTATVPFYPLPVTVVSRDGSRLAIVTIPELGRRGGTYRVTLLRSTGDTVFSRTYPFEGIPIPADAVDRRLESLRTGFGADIAAEAKRNVPPVYPPVDHLIVGRDGSVWLRQPAQPAGITWVVLGTRGDHVGSITLPRTTSVSDATRTQLWVTERDPDDLQSVVRYRITGIR